MSDSAAVVDTMTRFFAAVDDRRWDAARDVMTSPFHLDYSSFGGGSSETLAPDVVLARWKRVLPGFDRTHHLLADFEVDVAGDAAALSAGVTATHVIGNRVWTLVGTYRATLARVGSTWRLSGLRFSYECQHGPRELLDEARDRVRPTV